MILLYWVPTTIVPALCMLPFLSLAGSLTPDADSAPAGSLEGDLGGDQDSNGVLAHLILRLGRDQANLTTLPPAQDYLAGMQDPT